MLFSVLLRRKSNEGCKQKLVYVASEHEHGLCPRPIHVGKYMHERRKDFQLPYDIHWLNINNLVRPLKFENLK